MSGRNQNYNKILRAAKLAARVAKSPAGKKAAAAVLFKLESVARSYWNGSPRSGARPGPQRNARNRAPVATSHKNRGPSRKNGIRLRKREFFASLNGSVAFSSTKYQVNPGNPILFPWLVDVAKEWQRYKLHNVSIEYITRSATSSTGSVIISPEYDVYKGPAADEKQATNTAGAVEDVTWKNLTCRADKRMLTQSHNSHLVRTGAVANLPAYDALYFNVTTIGQANANEIGKLWISYDIEFLTAQVLDPVPSLSTSMVVTNTGPMNIINGVRTQLTNFVMSDDHFGAYKPSINTYSGGSGISLPVGYYMINLTFIVKTAAAAGLSVVSQLSEYSTLWTDFGPVQDQTPYNNTYATTCLVTIVYPFRSYIAADGKTEPLGISTTILGTTTINVDQVVIVIRPS